MIREDLKSVLAKMARYCAYQERSTGEVVKQMSKYVASQADRQTVLAHLEKEGFVDNQRYADAFAGGKFRLKKWGRIKIRYALKMKGIADDEIEDALNTIDAEEYASTVRKLIVDKNSTLAEKDEYTRKHKLARYAASRGFEADLVWRIIEGIL